MIREQISVFLENKPGSLAKLIRLLAAHKIDLEAMSISETSDYGILRILTGRVDETVALLMSENYSCKITQVLAVTVPDEPGSLTRILAVLAEHGVSISYSYAFFSREEGQASIVLRVADNDSVSALLRDEGIE